MADADLLHRLERIGWTVVDRGHDTECWEFDGCRKAKGYGKLSLGRGKTRMAHRISYEAHVSAIPEGLSVLHRCDNPPCINPDHLFIGTKAENNADMASKGRALQGEQHHTAKLNAESVRRIRSLGDAGMAQHELARRFGVAQSTVADIVHRRSWRSVQEFAA